MARREFRDQIKTLTQAGRFSNRALAAELGVSEKTIRRWRSGERTPDPDRYADVIEVVGDFDREVRDIDKREARREGYKPPDLPVSFPSQRAEFKDPFDPTKTIPADVIVYDVDRAEQGLSEDEIEQGDIFKLLQAYRDRAAMAGEEAGARFLVTTRRYKGKKVTYWWPPRVGEQPDLSEMSDDDLKDLLVEITLSIGTDGEIRSIRVEDALLKL